MNFFNKAKHSAASAPSPADQPPTTEPIMATTTPAPPIDDDTALDPAVPAPAAPGKKPRFARLHLPRPQFARAPRNSKHPPPPPPDLDVASVTDELAATHVTPPDPAKEARRAARRAARTKLEEQWAEEQHNRHRFAIETNLPQVPLTPLPEFHSASEDEAEQHAPDLVASSARDVVVVPDSLSQSQSQSHPTSDSSAPHVVGEGMPPPQRHQMKGPFIPPSPAHSHEPSSPQPPGPYIPPQQQHYSSHPHPQRNSEEDGRLAEMFGAQAYSGYQPPLPQASAPPPQEFHSHAQSTQPSAQMSGSFVRAPTNPTPIGWGDIYSSFPSQPMYTAPVHLAGGGYGPLDIDPVLTDRIHRGRELAGLAIEQEVQGNLGAAENGYMKALELLVPASKDLDIGPDLNKNKRMQMKAKIQREAAAMLDRCEELRVFLKANQANVPQELPSAPVFNQPSAAAKSSSESQLPPPLAPPKLDADEYPTSASTAGTRQTDSPDLPPPRRPPPPAPPSFHEDADDLFTRLTSRRNVLSNVSGPDAFSNGASQHSTAGAVQAKCFMCNAPAQIKTKCDHPFCMKCGNQAARVFGKCPVPGCNQNLNVDEFVKIL